MLEPQRVPHLMPEPKLEQAQRFHELPGAKTQSEELGVRPKLLVPILLFTSRAQLPPL